MGKLLLIFVLLVLQLQAINIEKYNEYHQLAIQAYYNQDSTGWLQNNRLALKYLPNSVTNLYYLANAFAQHNQPDSVIKYLQKVVEYGYGWEALNDDGFACIRNHPDYQSLARRIKELSRPVNTSEVVYTIAEKDLIPEGICYDPVEDVFYLSSLYKCKIIKINRDGSYSDFTTEKQDGLRSVVGMKVDAKRRILWALSEVSSLQYKNPAESEMGWSGVFKYDLDSGKLIKKYILHEDDKAHLFNDLIITSAGDIYFTDSKSQQIFKIHHLADTLEVFMENPGFGFLNGIALSKAEDYIYVAGSGPGIFRLNLADRSINYLKTPENVTTTGIDGLYRYENSLIAVQNGLGSGTRVVRFMLDKTGTSIENQSILEMKNPHFNVPTTGVIVGNDFYYIANSQLRSFNRNNSIFPMEKLDNVIVLKINLNY
ncbi:MAG: SMP-30/gluconolactonase/LRE family protein [Fidelibacterota bacterium]